MIESMYERIWLILVSSIWRCWSRLPSSMLIVTRWSFKKSTVGWLFASLQSRCIFNWERWPLVSIPFNELLVDSTVASSSIGRLLLVVSLRSLDVISKIVWYCIAVDASASLGVCGGEATRCKSSVAWCDVKIVWRKDLFLVVAYDSIQAFNRFSYWCEHCRWRQCAVQRVVGLILM